MRLSINAAATLAPVFGFVCGSRTFKPNSPPPHPVAWPCSAERVTKRQWQHLSPITRSTNTQPQADRTRHATVPPCRSTPRPVLGLSVIFVARVASSQRDQSRLEQRVTEAGPEDRQSKQRVPRHPSPLTTGLNFLIIIKLFKVLPS